MVAGTGNYNTAESIELSMEAEKQGVDGLLLVVPYYNKPPQEGLYRHFKAVAEHTNLPCIVYNVTSRTSLNMSHETTIRLSEIDNIVGIKEAGSDMDQIARIIEGSKPGFLVWSGNDNETFYIMSMGGFGVVSVASHLIGDQIKHMMGLLLEGDVGAGGRGAPAATAGLQGAVHRVQPHPGEARAEPGRVQRGEPAAALGPGFGKGGGPDRRGHVPVQDRPAGLKRGVPGGYPNGGAHLGGGRPFFCRRWRRVA